MKLKRVVKRTACGQFVLGTFLAVMLTACGQRQERTDSADAEPTDMAETEIADLADTEPMDMDDDNSEDFARYLMNHPETMDVNADSLHSRFGVWVDDSDDKQLRLYSWIHEVDMGGQYNNYTRQAYQYRGSNGINTVEDYLASLFPDDDCPFLDGRTSTGAIMTFALQDGGKLYVVPYAVIAEGGLTVYSFCAVTIKGNELKPVAVFPDNGSKGMKYVLIREIDFMAAPGQMHEHGDWQETYMKRGNELWVKTENVEDDCYDKYTFNGNRFVVNQQ